MPNSSPVRKRLTPEQRTKLLRTYRRSGLSQREFAAQAGVGLSTLQLWLRQATLRPTADTPPGFVELPNPLQPVAGLPVYRLHLAGGIELEVGSGFRPEEVASLLELLHKV